MLGQCHVRLRRGTFGDASAAVEGGSSASAADADGGHGGSDAGRLLVADATQPGSASGPAIVYGQSATTLYAVNPNTNDVTTVADFQGCSDEVIDLALDKDSNMYATSAHLPLLPRVSGPARQ